MDVRLARAIHPTAFTYEHVPAAVAYDVRSAPASLTLLGYLGPPPPLDAPPHGSEEHAQEQVLQQQAQQQRGGGGGSEPAAPTSSRGGSSGGGSLRLGTLAYDARGEWAVQTFQVSDPSVRAQVVDHVRLVVGANHGHPHHTCLYRLRVHGTLPADDAQRGA